MKRLNLKDSKGEFAESICFSHETQDSLARKLTTEFPAALKAEGVHCYTEEVEVKSGGLFGTVAPALLVSYPNAPTKFFDLAFIAWDGSLIFHYFGESKQNNKKNMHDHYQKNGNLLKAALCKPDEFILQKELNWGAAVWRVFNSLLK